MARPAFKIPSGLQTRAALEPSTFDAERGTVEVVFSTGARGKRRSWDGDYYEELEVSEKAVDLSRLNNRAPVLNAHASFDCRDVIGVVERAWIAGKQARALIRFSDREDVKAIRADVQSGVLCHVSVGYSVQKMEKVKEIDNVPVYRATRWTPHEISPVPMGFDDRAVVRGGSEPEFYEVEITSEERSMPVDTEPTSAPVVTEPAKPAAPVDNTRAIDPDAIAQAAREEAIKAERERATQIRSIVSKAKLDAAFGDDLIARGLTVEETRAAVLDRLATESEKTQINGQVRVEMGEDDREKFLRGASARMLAITGKADLVRRAAEKNPELFGKVEFDAGEFRGLSPRELARESLERAGRSTRGMGAMQMAGEALTHRSGMATTSDFSILFETAIGKILLASYMLADDTWSRFCKIDLVPDFRPSNRYRAGSFGSLDDLNEAGEFKNKAIPDGSKLSISVGTKGNIIALSRQAIVNDDMSALADLAMKLGRAGRLSIENDVYALLAENAGLGPTQSDSQPFFHANRKNVNAIVSAISAAGINADATVMRAQKDPSSNEYLSLRPSVLLVPDGSRAEALVINEAQFDPADNKFQKPNTVRGLFRDVVATPRLTGTRRYLFADPNDAAAIVVVFLEGQGQAPVLERQDGWRTDGTEWKVRLDYRAQMFDPKGAVTNAGQ